MFKCEYCDKEVKTEPGLKRHMNSCKLKDNQEPTSNDNDKAIETINEDKEVVLGSSTAQEIDRRIEKLKVTIRSCYDAETRYRLECELKDLIKKL